MTDKSTKKIDFSLSKFKAILVDPDYIPEDTEEGDIVWEVSGEFIYSPPIIIDINQLKE